MSLRDAPSLPPSTPVRRHAVAPRAGLSPKRPLPGRPWPKAPCGSSASSISATTRSVIRRQGFHEGLPQRALARLRLSPRQQQDQLAGAEILAQGMTLGRDGNPALPKLKMLRLDDNWIGDTEGIILEAIIARPARGHRIERAPPRLDIVLRSRASGNAQWPGSGHGDWLRPLPMRRHGERACR